MARSSGNQGRKSSTAAKAEPKGKGKAKPKRPSMRGATKAARERAARYAPNPHIALIAGDPLKSHVVAIALHRLYSPSEFARETGIALNVASYTFKVLREHGILELAKEEQVRGSTIKHYYRATQAVLVSETEWGNLAEPFRPVFASKIVQDFTEQVDYAIETGHLYSRDDFCLYWTPRTYDKIAYLEMVGIYNWLIEEGERLEVDTVNRRAEGKGGGSFLTTLAIAFFLTPTHEEVEKHLAKKGKSKAKRKARGKAKATSGKAKGTSNTRKASVRKKGGKT